MKEIMSSSGEQAVRLIAQFYNRRSSQKCQEINKCRQLHRFYQVSKEYLLDLVLVNHQMCYYEMDVTGFVQISLPVTKWPPLC